MVIEKTKLRNVVDLRKMSNWDYSSQKKKMPKEWRTINLLVHKIRLHGRRGKGMAESFSRQK